MGVSRSTSSLENMYQFMESVVANVLSILSEEYVRKNKIQRN